MKDLIGAVLCGGESRRMGSDKGLLPVLDTTWAGHISGKLEKAGLKVVISVNETQWDKYRALFPADQLIIDTAEVRGPLRGLLSVHQAFPEKDILLSGCDLIDMDLPTLEKLIRVYEAGDFYECYSYVQESLLEPLCCIYTSGTLKRTLEKAKSHTLEKFSLHSVIESSNTKRIPVENKLSFKNYNKLQE